MIDRLQAPVFGQVEKIELIRANPLILENGLKLFSIEGGTQEIVRVEFIFENLAYSPEMPLQAFATNTMLNDGSSELSSSEIADRIDYYGAFLQTEYTNDQSIVTLYSLSKHLESTLSIVRAIITDSVFPQEELDTFIRNQKQKLSVQLEKNDFVGRKKFNNVLFGNTLYGYDVQNEDYDKLDRKQLQEYFQLAYQPSNCTVIVSGKADQQIIRLISNLFGKDWSGSGSITTNEFTFSPGSGLLNYTEKEDALQSAIRIGQLAIRRSHADFAGFQVLNTIFGGYFGSRLMANIREDKGYTYGIGSALVSLKNAGYFFIASEVGADVTTQTMIEIEKEIKLLRSEPVSPEELDLVRNFMLGSMLGSLENAMSHADKFKNIYFSGLDYDYYEKYINTVRTISPDDILNLANTYLNYDALEKIVVGKV